MNKSLYSRPEFYDIFGIIGFLIIICLTVYALLTHNPLSGISLILFLLIGVIGLIVDSFMVYNHFFHNS